jgi:HD-GYP domain-containing protein (c-di-GMP phosphodiesterase class II)
MELSEKHYLNHLNEINKHNKIVLSEDIYNQHGALIVKKGKEITRELTCQLAKHKLVKPIDESITLTNLISYKAIVEQYSKLLHNLGVIDSIKESGYFEQTTRSIKLLFRYPLIIQKLTVLEQRLPDSFSRSLSTSCIALGVCKELNLSAEVTENIFIANFISDVGLLHLDPIIISKVGNYTAKEWEMMQGHVVIAKFFSDQVPMLSSQISRALLEHHERMDGFGYPFGKKASELSIEGQVLAIVDKVYGLAKKYIRNGTYSWHSILHAMQIPSTAHGTDMHNAMMRLLKSFSFPYKPAFEEHQYKAVVKSCLKKRQQLKLCFTEFDKICVNHNEQFLTEPEEFNAIGLLKKLECMIVTTGLLSESQLYWLTTLENEVLPSDYVDLEEFSLLLEEAKYSCFFVILHLEKSKDEFVEYFGSVELLTTFYLGLNNLLADS